MAVTAPVGTHCILELHGCTPSLLDDVGFVRDSLRQASEAGMSTLLHLTSHRFDPHGVTALALLAESHLSIHTWPEHGYAAVDAFTCGEHTRPELACQHLVRCFNASDHQLKILPRGGANLAEHHHADREHAQAASDACEEEPALCQAQN